MGGPSLRRSVLTPAERNGSSTQTSMVDGQCPSQGRWRISSGRSQKRNGRRPRLGLIYVLLGRSASTADEERCDRNRTQPQQRATSGWQPGSTSRRPVIFSLAQYLRWTKSRATANCWWCPYRTQTRERLFKNCPHWRTQQKILWAEVWKETGRGKSRFEVRDLFADERRSHAIPDFLATTDVGRRISDTAEEDSQSEMSEGELRERKEKAQDWETA